MLVIYYVCASADHHLIFHAECSQYKSLSMLLKKRFLHALIVCQKFRSLWRRVKNVQNDFKKTV